MEAMIPEVRSFNRTVTERIGVLRDGFLDRGRPLGEARLLWEIGPDGAEVRELRRRLGLDSGYVARMLSSLERQGLVSRETSPSDGRVRRVRLTAPGAAERAELDRGSDELAASVLEPLSDRQRVRLVAAMAEVERLLAASMVRMNVEDPGSPEARWCLERYFGELDQRFDAGFDPALSISADRRELTPPAGALVVVRLRGAPVGCGAIKLGPNGVCEVKRMWVAPDARGLGLGRRILLDLERRAAEAGARVLRLETNRSLEEAIALYRRSGYREVAPFNAEPYAHHWFEKRVSG